MGFLSFWLDKPHVVERDLPGTGASAAGIDFENPVGKANRRTRSRDPLHGGRAIQIWHGQDVFRLSVTRARQGEPAKMKSTPLRGGVRTS
jgi:hypothetical protein